MSKNWWDNAAEQMVLGLQLLTPGRGIAGRGGRPFKIVAIDSKRITVQSGKSLIPLDRDCFDSLQNGFSSTPGLWLRVASSHGEPFEGSADSLIRKDTRSDLARGNYICSILVHCGLVDYAMHGNQKGIQLPATDEAVLAENVSTAASGDKPPVFVTAKMAELIDGFQNYLEYFTSNLKFSGPSLYFHFRTIEAVRSATNYKQLLSDTRFCEYLYATLASWGMHRMGKGGAKMANFEELRNSIQNVIELCSATRRYQLGTLTDIDAPGIKRCLGQIFDNLIVMKSGAKLVGNSKLMHHLLPDLVPPIDREHTLRFFFGKTNFVPSSERILFLNCFDYFRKIAAAIGDKYLVFQGFNSSLPKIIDNAIMGYVMTKSKG